MPEANRSATADGAARAARAGGYAPIGDYAIIGDCRTCALVCRDGSVDWLCLPHFSGPSVFAAILDPERGGHLSVHPTAPYRTQRGYLGDTNLLLTRFESADGTLEVTDLMPLYPDVPVEPLEPQRELLRILEVTAGAVEIAVEYRPRPDYGRLALPLKRRGRLGWACQYRASLLNFNSDLALEPSADGTALHGRFRLTPGRRHHLSLIYAEGDIGVIAPLGEPLEQRTTVTGNWWRDWAERCTYRGPFRPAVVRSILVLKLLTYTLSGSVIAAPTTSLPEQLGGPLNWDYRFCWLRDASMTLRAFADLGYGAEGRAFMGWLLHATRLTSPELQVLYDVHGESRVKERELPHLRGYRDSRPVRIGNEAWSQQQLDVYGEVVLTAYDYIQRGGRLGYDERRVLRGIGDVVCRKWRERGQGLWEIRGDGDHFTHSKVMCWVALDRLLRLAAQGHLTVERERLARERAALESAIEEHCWNATLGSYVGAFDSDWLDASVLLMVRYGYRHADSPRMRSTFEQIERRLTTPDGLVYRYRSIGDRGPPGEGTFAVCGFWAVDYLARCGDVAQAQRRFETLLRTGNDLGLFAEETEPGERQALGNFPQAYSHVGLITAALSLAAAGEGRYMSEEE